MNTDFRRKTSSWLAVLASAGGLVFAAGALAAPPAPASTPPTGVTSKLIKAFNVSDVHLVEGVKPLACRGLRLRRLDVDPGGTIGLHSHENRPAILSIVGGEGMTVHAYKMPPVAVHYAQAYAELNEIVHYAVNLSKAQPLSLTTFDLLDDGSACNGKTYPDSHALLDRLEAQKDPFLAQIPTEQGGKSNHPIYYTPLADIQFPDGASPLGKRVMRARHVTLQPGATLPAQNYANRPSYIFVLDGSLHVKRIAGVAEDVEAKQTVQLINQKTDVQLANNSKKAAASYLVFELWDPADPASKDAI